MNILIQTGSPMQKREWLVKVISKLHLSLAMSLLMIAVSLAIGTNAYHASSAAVSLWIQQKFELIGLYVDAATWQHLLLAFAVIIAYVRPTPTTAFYMAWPLITYGGFLAWYSIEAQRIPLSAVVFMVWGFIVTLVLMTAWPTLIQAVVENVELRKQSDDAEIQVQDAAARSQL